MYDPHGDFGSSLNNITLGGKYKEELNDNPPPGYYDPDDALNMVKPHAPSTIIREDFGYKKPPEVTPDAGMYEPHEPFGLIP